MRDKQLWPRLLLAALFAALIFAFIESTPRHGSHPLEAFVTYYCGGTAVRAGVDPYATASVLGCEQRNEPGILPADVAEPAVLPPFALAAFSVFALLPYHVAGMLFLALSLGALLGAVAVDLRDREPDQRQSPLGDQRGGDAHDIARCGALLQTPGKINHE